MSKKHRKLWAEAVGKTHTPPQPKEKVPQSDVKPIRVQLPSKSDGRALQAVLESLARQLKTEHMNRPGHICLTDTHIQIEWESEAE